MRPNGRFFLLCITGHTMTNVPNRFHNSGKPAKRKLKPQQLRAARARRRVLLDKLTKRPAP